MDRSGLPARSEARAVSLGALTRADEQLKALGLVEHADVRTDWELGDLVGKNGEPELAVEDRAFRRRPTGWSRCPNPGIQLSHPAPVFHRAGCRNSILLPSPTGQ